LIGLFVFGLLGGLTIGVIVAALFLPGSQNQAAWTIIASALAAITSIFSAWTAQKVFETEEDSRKPYPYPSFDISSRLGLTQLRMTNFGGSTAHNIKIVWDKPSLNRKGEGVAFAGPEMASDIPILLPNERVAVLVDSTMSIFQEGSEFEMKYSREVKNKDSSGRSSSHPFMISLEQYHPSFTYDAEEPKTLRELQRLQAGAN